MSRRYTVEHTRGCVVIHDPIPVDDLVGLIGAWDKSRPPVWIAHAGLGTLLNVALVCGPPDACQAWYDELKPERDGTI